MLLIFVISIWSLSYYTSLMLRADMQRQLSEQQSSTVAFVAGEINDELTDRLVVLEKAAGKITTAVLRNPSALQAFLEEQLILQGPFNAGVVAIGAEGTALAELPRTIGVVGVNLMERDHVVGALKHGKSTIGRPVMGKKVQSPIVVMATPIRDPQGKVIGALTGLTDLAKPNFLDKVTESHYGKTGGYVLVAPQHQLIVTATDKRLIMTPLTSPGKESLIDRFVEGFEGSGVMVNRMGVEVLVSAKQIPLAGWYVTVTLPTREAFALIEEMQRRTLLITVFFTLLAGGLTWWLLKHQLAPILATVDTLSKLSDGSQPPRLLPVSSKDEVGELISGFNRLLETMSEQGAKLRESEELWKFAIEGTGAGVLDWDIPSGAMHFSDRWLEMTGYSREETLPKVDSLTSLVHPEDFPPAMADVQRVLEGSKPVHMFEHRLKHKQGHWLWIQSRGVISARGEHGEPLRMIGTHIDITERKRGELSMAQLAVIVENSQDAIVSHDMGLQVITWNSAAERLFGCAAREVVGKRMRFIVPEDKRAEVDRNLALIAQGKRVTPFETERLARDGRRIDVSVTQSPILDAHGAIIGVSVIFRDISERKRAEAEHARLETQLRESQKMEALGTLAGGVAHDFNNALAAILGNTELARQDVGSDHPALESLEEIGKASRRAKDLVQQILAFSRRQKLERKATSLSLIVVESARMIRATLPVGVSLNVECKTDVPAVLADATQVKQLLLNLCANAAQAIRDQGRPGLIEIILSAHVQSAEAAIARLAAGRYACLTVRDNGSGMNDATRAHIFEPFFTTKPKGKGTGLGLSVVHGIVQAHEASIVVDTVPGAGSAFHVYFPALDAPVPELPAPTGDSTPIQGSGRRVLYVDDEEAIVFLMKRLLERQGFHVSGFTEQNLALEALRAHPDQFDLAVTDYNMPGMSGLELARAMKQVRADLPVVLASGYITEELRAAAPSAGIAELIYKPNTVDDLCEAVARLAREAGNKEPSA